MLFFQTLFKTSCVARCVQQSSKVECRFRFHAVDSGPRFSQRSLFTIAQQDFKEIGSSESHLQRRKLRNFRCDSVYEPEITHHWRYLIQQCQGFCLGESAILENCVDWEELLLECAKRGLEVLSNRKLLPSKIVRRSGVEFPELRRCNRHFEAQAIENHSDRK